MPERPELLSGWGRTAPTRAHLHDHCDPEEVARLLADPATAERGLLPRGLGRSYGDAAQNAGGTVVRLDPRGPLEIDAASATAVVGGGVSLEHLVDTALPLGLFPMVTPGTQFVTVGGAIACDVHGKNHHRDGTFGQHVLSLDLLDGTGRLRTLAPPDPLFWATVGGMGLTGVVVSARIRLRRVESAYLRVDTDRVSCLDDLLDLMRETEAGHTYSVAWIDLLARGRSLGRSVLSRGEHATAAEVRAAGHPDALHEPRRLRLAAPPWAPSGLMNRATIGAFNELWFRRAPRQRRGDLEAIRPFFHPLDGVAGWNRLYGGRGLVQYQLALPFGAEEALREVVGRISDSRHASFLAVLKTFGDANPAPLSFPVRGWTLALDLPADPALRGLFDTLDDLVVAAGGRLYLAKDSRLAARRLAQMYPGVEDFRRARRELDPDGVFRSDLSRRLQL